MATITIKNLPDDLYEHLKRSAARNRRSINREAIVCLERALTAPQRDARPILARAKRVRERLDLYVTDEELRGAREEGRP